MKGKHIALLLVLTLALSLCAAPALADKEAPAAPEGLLIAPAPTQASASPAGPDPEPAVDPETGKLIEEVTIAPDEVGFVSFANVERRMREKNLSVLALEESVLTLEEMDYEEMKDYLRDQMELLATGMAWQRQASEMPEGSPYYEEFNANKYGKLETLYASAEAQFDAIRDGELQKDNAGALRQLKNLQDQIVLGAELQYIALAGLEVQDGALQRQLASLNRTVEELNLRYQMGQISALQLQQAEAGQTALASGMETLRMNIRNLNAGLEQMLGVEVTGELRLGAVPEVTAEQLDAMDLEKDLSAAKTASYDLYAATKTLEDAKEEYEDAEDIYDYDDMFLAQAKHKWNAAQFTYNNTVQSWELSFRSLYAQVKDCKQILEAAKVSLEGEKASAAAAELRYQQGTISENALLTARDALAEAEEKVFTAGNDLFSSYNSYCWAVQHGILI